MLQYVIWHVFCVCAFVWLPLPGSFGSSVSEMFGCLNFRWFSEPHTNTLLPFSNLDWISVVLILPLWTCAHALVHAPAFRSLLSFFAHHFLPIIRIVSGFWIIYAIWSCVSMDLMKGWERYFINRNEREKWTTTWYSLSKYTITIEMDENKNCTAHFVVLSSCNPCVCFIHSFSQSSVC